jgi:hypothetical protein
MSLDWMGWILGRDIGIQGENIKVRSAVYIVSHEACSVLAASEDDDVLRQRKRNHSEYPVYSLFIPDGSRGCGCVGRVEYYVASGPVYCEGLCAEWFDGGESVGIVADDE